MYYTVYHVDFMNFKSLSMFTCCLYITYHINTGSSLIAGSFIQYLLWLFCGSDVFGAHIFSYLWS